MSESRTKDNQIDEDESDESDEKAEDIKYECIKNEVSSIPTSPYILTIVSEPIVDYRRPINHVDDLIKQARYSELPNYMDIPPTESYKMFIKSFNELSRDSLNSPPKNLADYANYITSLIPQKACFQIATAWPPCIPRVCNTMEPLTGLMLKIISEVNDPINFLRFMSESLFPRVWTNSPSDVNELLYAASPCIHNGYRGCWAILERESNMFRVLTKNKKGEIVEKVSGKAVSCVRSKGNKAVIVKGQNKRITSFEPVDHNLVSIWTHVLRNEEEDDDMDDDDELNPPFTYFLSPDERYFPDILYPAFYNAITSNDMVIPRAIMANNPPYRIVKCLLNIFLHTRKTHLLYSTVIADLLSSNQLDPIHVYAKDSFYRKFVSALWETFGTQYIDDFLKKIIKLVDKSQRLTEKLFFTVVKYITKSTSYIPMEIRHFASIMRSYIAVRFNSRGFEYILLGGFFGLDFVCPVIATPDNYMRDLTSTSAAHKRVGGSKKALELENPENLKEVSRLLQYVFHGALLPSGYSTFNKRLMHHVFPEMEEFLFSLGDIPNDMTCPSPPSSQELVSYLDKTMHYMSDRSGSIRITHKEDSEATIGKVSPIGLNFASTFIDFFVQYYDKEVDKKRIANRAKKVEPKKLSMPSLPLYGLIPSKKDKKKNDSFPLFCSLGPPPPSVSPRKY